MAMIKCPECGKKISNLSPRCINCGAPVREKDSSAETQQVHLQEPYNIQSIRQKTPAYKKAWFWVVCIIGIGIIGTALSNNSASDESPKSPVSPSASSTSSEMPKLSSEDEGLLKVIQYHKDKINGTESSASLKGTEVALGVNLSMYKPKEGEDNFKYRSYYYALKGEQEYLNEFGDDRLSEIKDHILKLDSENILEQAFESYAREEARIKAEEEAKIIDIDYTILYKDYMDNPIAADKEYKGKVLRLTGKVSDIDREIMGETYITFEIGTFENIRLTFKKSEEDNVAALKKGQKVTVVGECTGTLLSTTVALKNCYIDK